MIPGEFLTDGPDHVLNADRRTTTLVVVNPVNDSPSASTSRRGVSNC